MDLNVQRREARSRARRVITGIAAWSLLWVVLWLVVVPRSCEAQGAPGVSRRELPVIRLTAGMVITRSVRIAPGRYAMRAPVSDDSALITIRGHNLTVDFRGVTLIGQPPDSTPDAAVGTAVRIDGGRNVRVHGLTAHGYRFGIRATAVRGLTLEGLDLGYGWKPRLFSVVEHESLNDWLSYHKNEQNEWLRFGAGIHLRNVTGGMVRRVTVRQSMNGLLLSHSDSLTIRDNDFSYNSGLGIGMYRASWHTIVGNRVDYAVRGYSHGFFARGQDSAALLMFEQCTHNVVAYNSMTHSGDGLFLWAGQQTMDTGQGGSNDNLFLANDFSFAPTNGMEATFSRNDFIGNRVEGSTHGLWGGYSYDSRVVGNCFANNRIAIAVEHGQKNLVGGNRFTGDTLAIRLWGDSIEPSDWGYPKHRDTRSREWRIVENLFVNVPERLRVANTTIVDSLRNVTWPTDSAGVVCDPIRRIPTTAWWRTPAIPESPRRWPTSAHASAPRSAIVVDEWGPYDGLSPKLWPVDSTRAMPLRLAVLGPRGRWRVVARDGVASLSAITGRMGDTLIVLPDSARRGDWRITLEYRGVATVSPRGVRTPAGVPVRFAYTHFEPAQRWTQRVWAYADSADPWKAPEAFARLLTQPPRFMRDAPRLDLFWSRPRDAAFPTAKFVVEATSDVLLPPGRYTVRTLSDDAVQLWVDDRLVIDHWTPHETAPAYATIDGGAHRLRVRYAQVGGWVELRLDILRGVVRSSPGSAGPH